MGRGQRAGTRGKLAILVSGNKAYNLMKISGAPKGIEKALRAAAEYDAE